MRRKFKGVGFEREIRRFTGGDSWVLKQVNKAYKVSDSTTTNLLFDAASKWLPIGNNYFSSLTYCAKHVKLEVNYTYSNNV